MRMRLSYCVVNTGGRELLLSCLEAIERTAPPDVEREVLVLDNASDDGSAEAVRERWPDVRLIALERRAGKGANDTTLLREARGDYCLLLNEDSELTEGAAVALLAALEGDSGVAVAGAQLLDQEGNPVPCAWRLPGVGTGLAGAAFLHKWLTVQSGGEDTRRVGWVQSSAMLVRNSAAEQVGYLDPAFYVYSDETDFEKRLRDAGWEVLYVPAARAVHHDQMASDDRGAQRRTVEYHRNRDLYLRKHKGRVVAFLLRPLHAFPYLLRAAAALVLPGHSARRYWLHACQALRPGHGEGIREAAEAYNLRIGPRRESPAQPPPAPPRSQA
jgi:N-acetylglucosaminyl-diphospho-decaprenol L-rhamnosyltransferase